MLHDGPVGRDDVTPLIEQLAGWDEGTPYSAWLHVGDVGWLLRLPDEVMDGQLHAWWDGDRLVAVSLLERAMARPRVRLDLTHDRTVAASVADVLEGMVGEQLWSDAEPGTTLRQELVSRGWGLDAEPYVAFYAGRGGWRAPVTPDARRAVADPTARVAVQRAGFANSTFDEPSWRRMAAGPAYRPELDLVVHDPDDGAPAACATGWLSVPGGPAVLEPVATHGDKRGRGLGRAAVVAAVAACLDAGASAVTVATPGGNAAAVAAYRSAGMRDIETIQGLTLNR